MSYEKWNKIERFRMSLGTTRDPNRAARQAHKLLGESVEPADLLCIVEAARKRATENGRNAGRNNPRVA